MRINIKIDETVRNLTLQFVAVLMAVVVVASMAIYVIAERQLDAGLRRQQNEIIRRQIPLGPFTEELTQLSLKQYQEARNRLLSGLIIFNLVSLAGGTYLCYSLARRTLKPIEESLEAQNRFIADASHELRTPLTAMKTELEVAIRQPRATTTELKNILQSTLEEVNELQDLSESLLLLAKLPYQRSHQAVEEIKPELIVNKAMEKILPLAKTKKLKIILELDADYPKKLTVNGDRVSLERLVLILLDNAVKYSQEKQNITISLSQNSGQVLIAVADNGPGISPKDMRHLFERFYRSDRARTSDGKGGYGLGLPIAKAIAEFHGGKIDVRSKQGAGATFTLSLPVSSQSLLK